MGAALVTGICWGDLQLPALKLSIKPGLQKQRGAAASSVALSHLYSNTNAVEQPLVHHSLGPRPQLHKPPLLILDQLQRQQVAGVNDRQASRQAGRGRKVEAELAGSFLRPMLRLCGKWPYLQFARR